MYSPLSGKMIIRVAVHIGIHQLVVLLKFDNNIQ